ncbi:hypothetical protein MSAN_01910300 [Mycena sanguinolenta]|uniref:Uncharacterized protein n=1 Tax=Mycena sanguinolenta TaxID=230812 RepID=A0A8H6XRW7_9AGAR|nr:hypothetical protein MSAN_01910300 [Mycena sanguinolenta]
MLPPELVQTIVAEVDDIPSLKACALAASMFCNASQRILFRSFTLEPILVPASSTILEESPHIASYITRLSIQLGTYIDDASNERLSQNLQKNFANLKLANVRQCIMNGSFHCPKQTPTFVPALLDFLLRQPLCELHVSSAVQVAPATILRLLTAAPVISFSEVYIEKHSKALLDRAQYTPIVEDLFVDSDAREVYEIVVQSESLANTLRRLSIEYLDPRRPGMTIPPLPLLHSFQFSLLFLNNGKRWLSDLILSVMSTSPLLADIVISFLVNKRVGVRPSGALETLDAALAVHPMRPTILWRLHFTSNVDENVRTEIFDKFTVGVQIGMPRSRGEKRLVLESLDSIW